MELSKQLIVAVSQSDREPAALKSVGQVHHPEHLHPVRRNGVFLPDYANLPEAESFDQLLNHLDVRDRFVG